LSKELVELVSHPRIKYGKPFIGYICKLLDLLISLGKSLQAHRKANLILLEASEQEVAPENTPVTFLEAAVDRESPTDMEEFVAIVNTALSYLQHVKFQRALIAKGGLETTLTILVDSYTRFDSQDISPLNGDDIEDLFRLRSKLNQALSDISALPEFTLAVPVISPFTSSLRLWISSPQLQLQVCACIILGNLARSDTACEEFVHTSQVHKPLISVLANVNDAQVLHAVLGFLKNLALPIKNKEALGDAGILDILPRLWLIDSLQQIQYSSISLTRQLLTSYFPNVRRLFQRLSADTDSPAHNRSNLSLLVALFDRTEAEPIKMEISRLLTAICRVVSTYTGYPPERMDHIQKKFFTMHPDVGRPLGFMVSQTKWPAVRSEGWFVFAVMARHSEGAQCINAMLEDAVICQPLIELLSGKNPLGNEANTTPGSEIMESSPSFALGPLAEITAEESTSKIVGGSQNQANEILRADRENGLVLVNELLKNAGAQMAVMRRTFFEDLLKGGGEVVRAQ